MTHGVNRGKLDYSQGKEVYMPGSLELIEGIYLPKPLRTLPVLTSLQLIFITGKTNL